MRYRSTYILLVLVFLFGSFSANANGSPFSEVDEVPEAIFGISEPTGCAPHSTDFSDFSTGDPTDWNWTFEGGTPATSTDQEPVVDFNTPGEFLVTLIVSNAEGSDTAIAKVFVYAEPPVANFHYEISGNTTTFTNLMSNTDTHLWEFGDGSSSTELNPAHTYAEEGTYIARLKASNNCTTDIALEVVVIGDNYQAIGHNANDYIAPYDQTFLPGTNLGYNPPYSDIDLANIAAGNPDAGVQGVGVKVIRPFLPETFLEQHGYDVRLDEFEHYGNLELKENTLIVGFPSDEHRDTTHYCPDHQSELFANMYEDIWDNGENGTPINDNNPLALYLYKTVHLYKDNVTFYEIWNEPGFDYTFLTGWLPQGEDGNWWENNPDPCDYKLRAPIFHYVRILRTCYEVINYIDPDAFITLGSVGFPSFMDAVLRNTDNPVDGSPTADYPLGGGAYFDVVSIHSYPHFDGTLREWDEDIMNFIHFRHSDAAAFGIERTRTIYQDVLYDYGYDGITYPEKKWMVTEINIPRKQFADYIGSEEAQTNYIIKAYIAAVKQEMLQMHIYDLAEPFYYDDAVNEFQLMGLYQRLFDIYPYNETVNNEGIAYKTTSDLIYSSHYDEVQTAAMQLPDTLDGAAFLDVNGHYTYVIWSKTYIDNSEATSATYTFPVVFNISSLEKREWDHSQTTLVENISGENISLNGRPIFLTDLNNTTLIAPTVDFDLEESTGCIPFTVDFIDQSSTNVTNWQWTFEGGTPTTSNEQNPSITYNQAGTYSVTLEVSNTAGANTLYIQDFVVVSENLPTASFTEVVDGPVVTFINTSENALTYNWNLDDGYLFTEANPTHTYTVPGYYDIELLAHNGCGTDTLIQTIIVDPTNVVPMAEFTSGVSSGCSPLAVQFFDQSTPNTTGWWWQFQGGSPSTSTEQNPVVTFDTPGSYFVKLVASNDAGSDTEFKADVVTVTDAAPTVDFTFGTSSLNAFFFSSANDASSLLWEFGDGNFSNEEDPSHTYAMSGDYEVTLTATNGCGSTSITYTVSVSSFPSAGFSATPLEGCAPQTIQFNSEATSNTLFWNWSFPGGTPNISDEQNPVIVYDNPGTYEVSQIVSNNQGFDTLTIVDYISIGDIPTANFDLNQTDNQIILNNTSTNANNYFWNFGDNNGSTDISPSHEYTSSGDYSITLIATNDCGSDTTSQTVTVEITSINKAQQLIDFSIAPNPNEGHFHISIKGQAKAYMSLAVYNLLGQQVWAESLPFMTGTFEQNMDWSFLPPGGYVVRAEGAVLRVIVVKQ